MYWTGLDIFNSRFAGLGNTLGAKEAYLEVSWKEDR
jgi:hypothetical protein